MTPHESLSTTTIITNLKYCEHCTLNWIDRWPNGTDTCTKIFHSLTNGSTWYSTKQDPKDGIALLLTLSFSTACPIRIEILNKQRDELTDSTPPIPPSTTTSSSVGPSSISPSGKRFAERKTFKLPRLPNVRGRRWKQKLP